MNNILKIILGAAALMLLPLIAMQFNNGVSWAVSDFAAAWVMLVGIGVSLLTALDKTKSLGLRALSVLVTASIFWLWAELAVGVFTNWGS